MKVVALLRPVDLARAVGLSSQSVRVYERLGFLPTSQRSVSGHRRYETVHLRAIEASRLMQAGYGWQSALTVMKHVHAGELEDALVVVDGCHARLHAQRQQVAQVLQALRIVFTSTNPPGGHRWSWRQRPLYSGDVARMVGVTVPSVRFWEARGLLHPQRERSSGYRVYNREQITRLQVIALLRDAGYDLEKIGEVLSQLGDGRPEQALQAVERRRADLALASRRCMEATAALNEYVHYREEL